MTLNTGNDYFAKLRFQRLLLLMRIFCIYCKAENEFLILRGKVSCFRLSANIYYFVSDSCFGVWKLILFPKQIY